MDQVHVLGIFCRSQDELDLAPIIPDESLDVVDDMLSPSNISRLTFSHLTSTVTAMNSGLFESENLSSQLNLKLFLSAQKLKYNETSVSFSPGKFIGLTDHTSRCQQELLADTFLVLLKSLEFSRTESTMMVYRNTGGQDVRFVMHNDAVVQDFITWSDVWFFVIAIAVNIMFAGILACVGTAKLKSFCTEFLLNDFNTKGMLATASHRLDHEVSSKS